MDDSDDTSNFHYQSFTTPAETSSTYAFCTCDYCLNFHPYKLEKGLSLIKRQESKSIQCRKSKSNSANKVKPDNDLTLLKNRSFSEVHDTGRSDTEIRLESSQEISVLKNQNLNSSFSFYELWQSEKFKANAFEKDNERLELLVKDLETKLEKETQQQIRISLEWRKTVMKLVDENTHLKQKIESYKTD